MRLRTEFGFSYGALATALQVPSSTVHRWRSAAGASPTPVFLHRLAAFGTFLEELDMLMEASAAAIWLDVPLPSLRGRTPREVIQAGHVDRVTGIVMAMNAGMPL